MSGSVSVKELIDEVNSSNVGYQSFVNRRTGEIYGSPREFLQMSEGDDEPDAGDWQKEIYDKLREIRGSDDWLILPQTTSRDSFDVMRGFISELTSGALQDALHHTLRGPKPFRRFKDLIISSGLLESWTEHHERAIAKDLRGWLDLHQIPYRD
jgi:hypothetical protein